MSKQHYTVETYNVRRSVGYLLRRASILAIDAVEPTFASLGFTFTQYLILVWLRDGIAINAKDLCGELLHDSGALARVIDQLVERGLIERLRGLDDRRKVDLRLTDAGREAVAKLVPTVLEMLNAGLADFSTREALELERLLHKFGANIEALSTRHSGLKE